MSRVSRKAAIIVGAFAASLGALAPQSQAQDYGQRPWWEDDRPWWESPRPIRRPPPADRDDAPDEENWQGDNGDFAARRDQSQRYDEQFEDEDDWRSNPRYRRSPGQGRPALPEQSEQPDDRAEERNGGKVAGVDGGDRPYIAPQAPPMVAFGGGAYRPGSIVIDTNGRKLYYVTRPGAAFAYPIGVGRDGFTWTGVKTVSRIQDWPDWYPPEEMRKRKPELPERMLGGLRNPLGAKAIYLGTSLYRIHGTNDPKSIGRAESSGCFRMLNAHVLHLAGLVPVGTQVTVVKSLGRGAVASDEQRGPKPRVAQRVRPRFTEEDRRPAWRERPYRRYRWWEYDPYFDYR